MFLFSDNFSIVSNEYFISWIDKPSLNSEDIFKNSDLFLLDKKFEL